MRYPQQSRAWQRLKRVYELVDGAVTRFSDRGGTMLSAALAFYALLSSAPLLVLAVTIAGVVFGQARARRTLLHEVSERLGHDVAVTLRDLMNALEISQGSVWAVTVSLVVMAWAAGRLFVQLQDALNIMWGVRARRQDRWTWRVGYLVRKRLLSFSMVLLCGTLLLFLVGLQAVVAIVLSLFSELLPFQGIWQLVDVLMTLGLLTVLFAIIYKILPDVRIGWRDVWIGALSTAVMASLGMLGLGLYFRYVGVGSTLGAVGSLALLVLWAYYSAHIFFFGAAFTQTWARHQGRSLEPEAYAMWVRTETEWEEERTSG